LGIVGLYLLVTLAFPLYAMLSKSFQNREGVFIGLANYIHYFSTPALSYSIYNSLYPELFTKKDDPRLSN